jgi:molecular chaperone HscA
VSKKPGSFVRFLFGKASNTPSAAGSVPPEPQGQQEAAGSPLTLDLSLLRVQPNKDWLACVDFGTALSKICMVRRHQPGTATSNDVKALRIGPRTTEQGGSVLAPSTLYILQDRIYFGDRALQVSAEHNDSDRERFESPKQILSEMASDALDLPPNRRQDPTQCLTRGDLMALLLAHLIWRAVVAAQTTGLQSLPKLRFARPAWDKNHALRGEERLLQLFAKAFVIASSLQGRLDDPRGVPMAEARWVLEQLNAHGEKHLDLLKKRVEIGPDTDDCIDRGFVPEATAVAAAAIRPERGVRRIIVVIDVGAGTSDFGAFVTVPGQGDGRISELQRGRRVVLRGGNFLDEQVIALLKDKAGLVDGMPAAISALAYLKREASRLKEDLFRQGRITVRLSNGQFVRASLSELLEREPVQDFAQELCSKFSETLSVATDFTRGLTLSPNSIEVILTGGGSQLPMVKDLLAQVNQVSLHPVTRTDVMPSWLDANLSQLFPQLAVALGGAMPVLPEQR